MSTLDESMDRFIELGRKSGLIDMIVELRKIESINSDYDKGVRDCIKIIVDEYNKLEKNKLELGDY